MILEVRSEISVLYGIVPDTYIPLYPKAIKNAF